MFATNSVKFNNFTDLKIKLTPLNLKLPSWTNSKTRDFQIKLSSVSPITYEFNHSNYPIPSTPK